MDNNMKNASYENVDDLAEAGFRIKFVTMKANSPRHWHRTLEVLYILNGSAMVKMDGREYQLNPLDFIVLDASKVHEVIYAPPQTMGICIHISKTFMRKYIKDIELLHISCLGMDSQRLEAYVKLGEYLKELTLLYMNQKKSYLLQSNACVLEILSVLLDYYSEPVTESLSVTNIQNLERLEEICNYVDEHYSESISLDDVTQEFLLNKEYFCRFFKQNMGTTFMKYVNQVRLDHIYQDLISTQDGTMEIMERHGFYNQKVFYRMFKETYHCTPRELRKLTENNVFLNQ